MPLIDLRGKNLSGKHSRSKVVVDRLEYKMNVRETFSFRLNMANVSGSNFTKNLTNVTTEGKPRNVALENSFITAIIINSITCPFTVLLNVLVIMAVKRRPRLQSNSNILRACLAVTDVLTGLLTQPSFILWKTLYLLGTPYQNTVGYVSNSFFRALSVCSCLHLMLVTCERLVAIKFTTHYPYIVIKRNIKVAVISFWIVAIFWEPSRLIDEAAKIFFNLLVTFVLLSCVLCILISYVILYRETLRHRKMIKTQQLPQEEVERFVIESKALNTTVLVVGAVLLCFVPLVVIILLSQVIKLNLFISITNRSACTPCPLFRTFAMLNSLFNLLIYCWRQKEMRQSVFRLSLPQAVAPA